MLDGDRESVRADAVAERDRLALASDFPEAPNWSVLTTEMAELLGLLCGDGWVERAGRRVCFTNNDPRLRARVALLWSRCFLKGAHDWVAPSGFAPETGVGKLNLHTSQSLALWLREELYTRTAHKQVPHSCQRRRRGTAGIPPRLLRRRWPRARQRLVVRHQ